MGRNFLLKFEDVRWDDDPNGEKLKAWEEGRTGFPFIDAGMRQMKEQGWMHNRVRMAVGSFLVKDLMLNWKEGERIFSRNLIDGDLGSNNAGELPRLGPSGLIRASCESTADTRKLLRPARLPGSLSCGTPPSRLAVGSWDRIRPAALLPSLQPGFTVREV